MLWEQREAEQSQINCLSPRCLRVHHLTRLGAQPLSAPSCPHFLPNVQVVRLMCWQMRCLPIQQSWNRNPPWYQAGPRPPYFVISRKEGSAMTLPLKFCVGRGKVYETVLIYTLVFRTFSLNSEVALPGGYCAQKIRKVRSLSRFSCYWISEWGDRFGLSLAVHYRLLGMCAWCCIVPHCAWFAGVCIPPISPSLLYCLALLCSASGLGHLFIAFCIPSVLPKGGRNDPLAEDEPTPFPLVSAFLWPLP